MKNHIKISKSYKKTAIITVLLVIITAIVAIGVYQKIPKECNTESCLIQRADACQPTVYRTEAGSMILEMKVIENCSTITTVVGFKGNLTPAREEMIGKRTICDYEKGKYEEALLNYDTMPCVYD